MPYATLNVDGTIQSLFRRAQDGTALVGDDDPRVAEFRNRGVVTKTMVCRSVTRACMQLRDAIVGDDLDAALARHYVLGLRSVDEDLIVWANRCCDAETTIALARRTCFVAIDAASDDACVNSALDDLQVKLNAVADSCKVARVSTMPIRLTPSGARC